MSDEILDKVLAEGDLVAIELDPFAEVSDAEAAAAHIRLEAHIKMVREAAEAETAAKTALPPRMPTDLEVQEALTRIAHGIVIRVRSTAGPMTDTFVAGGDYAPGRQRWVQTPAFDSAEKQAEAIAASLQ